VVEHQTQTALILYLALLHLLGVVLKALQVDQVVVVDTVVLVQQVHQVKVLQAVQVTQERTTVLVVVVVQALLVEMLV
jgi:hypothetical protein